MSSSLRVIKLENCYSRVLPRCCVAVASFNDVVAPSETACQEFAREHSYMLYVLLHARKSCVSVVCRAGRTEVANSVPGEAAAAAAGGRAPGRAGSSGPHGP